ncbi:glycosyltransferase family 32 protein [Babjeviella inositovora NRRL Y-12698]|uniref:Glycosyltransferase family 32 protein n=1 Tax=Babjeviella inositovora NRRL Y-12698 TaxID=984486 RepID=A0A1E3QN80_9ASCO|nr:glycosyltransferase family 32 protein [Babjeviella inositovora NRRL Y-12698]ODQ79131.1 glycosyltransferase family 32 protein [Babjeviella inositovora NRRL Y-12698]
MSLIQSLKQSRRVRLCLVLAMVLYVIFSIVSQVRIAPQTDPAKYTTTSVKESIKRLQKDLEKVPNFKLVGAIFSPNRTPLLPIIIADGDKLSISMRQQLSYQFPYEASHPIPNIIWQTWKVDTAHKQFPAQFHHNQLKWKMTNPTHTHYVLSDEGCSELIESLYASVPQVLKAYQILPTPILKADFFRYLILLARGGVYSDMDTLSLKPIDRWPATNPSYTFSKLDPQTEDPLTPLAEEVPGLGAGLVLGIEADPDRPDWHDWYARRIQFCQWTIQSKVGHPMLRELVIQIALLTLKRAEDGNLSLAKGDKKGEDIMNWTGPGIFTDFTFKYLNNLYGSQGDGTDAKTSPISWEFFTGMERPLLVDDVMILPITSFSPGVGHMGSKEVNDEMALVHHLFKGSWKDKAQPGGRKGS